MSEWLARLLWSDPEPEPEGPTPEPEEEAGEVEAATAAHPIEIELAAHPGPPPLDVLEEDPLGAVEGWSPEDRIRRSFAFGQQDALSALFQRFPSVVEAKAYVVGASCRWPNQAF